MNDAERQSASVEVNLCAFAAVSIPDPKKIGARIAQARREKSAREGRDVTHGEIARHLRVSVGAISKWENGVQLPRANRLVALAALLGVTVDYLLSGPEVVTIAPVEDSSPGQKIKAFERTVEAHRTAKRRTPSEQSASQRVAGGHPKAPAPPDKPRR